MCIYIYNCLSICSSWFGTGWKLCLSSVTASGRSSGSCAQQLRKSPQLELVPPMLHLCSVQRSRIVELLRLDVEG